MLENTCLVRAPLLDPKQPLIGYKLAWQKNEKSSGLSNGADLHQLLVFVAEHVSNSTVVVDQFSGWREFDACAPLGLNGFFGSLCLIPQTVLILPLM